MSDLLTVLNVPPSVLRVEKSSPKSTRIRLIFLKTQFELATYSGQVVTGRRSQQTTCSRSCVRAS